MTGTEKKKYQSPISWDFLNDFEAIFLSYLQWGPTLPLASQDRKKSARITSSIRLTFS